MEDIVQGASAESYLTKAEAIRNAIRNGMPRDASLVEGVTQEEIDRALGK